jgi:hypothetical protein
MRMSVKQTQRLRVFGPRWIRIAAGSVLALVLLLPACDRLLEVTVPGRVLEEDLNDPQLATTLALGAQGDFECTFLAYVLATGLWTTDFLTVGATRTQHQIGVRAATTITFTPGDCASTNPHSVWLPVNVSRIQGETAARLITGFPDAAVPNKDYLLAKAHAYTGYAYQLAGEAMCELAFDNGPMVTRQETFKLAETRFTSALEHAARVPAGADLADAQSLGNMARVGRARARLNMGDGPGAVADARLVPVNFVRNVTTSDADPRRRNRVFTINNESRDMAMNGKLYANLRVGTVADPRVPLRDGGGAIGFDGVTYMWYQSKYLTRSTPLPFATWREAQLMIAEVEGGQSAVNVINTLRATHNLPQFSSSNPAEIRAQVIEERRRELWMQGTRLGDMLRLNQPFTTGEDPRGESYGPYTCMPLPDVERLNNPNF